MSGNWQSLEAHGEIEMKASSKAGQYLSRDLVARRGVELEMLEEAPAWTVCERFALSSCYRRPGPSRFWPLSSSVQALPSKMLVGGGDAT